MVINKRENDKSKRSPINEEIDAANVRLILDDGTQQGIVTLKEALEAARAVKLDLVLISPEADPVFLMRLDAQLCIFALGIFILRIKTRHYGGCLEFSDSYNPALHSC